MPRQSRIDAPGALHHVMIRGIEKTVIFRNDNDRDLFLDRLGGILLQSSTPCYAWSLLDNHAHFLLRTGTIPVAHVMRRLLTGYAVTFNRRYRRHGHLFQNRYKSILCEEDAYLQELVRYIHLNPFRAGLVRDLKELGQYAYSGHSAVIGKRKRPWQDRDYVLKFFGRTEWEATRGYVSYVAKGVGQGRRAELVGGGLLRSAGGWKGLQGVRESGEVVRGDERILGGSEFVERVLKESQEGWEKKYLFRKNGYSLEWLLGRVAAHFGVTAKAIKSTSKVPRVAKARAVVCHVGARKLGVTSAAIAKELGISPSAVSKAIARTSEALDLDHIEKKVLECQ